MSTLIIAKIGVSGARKKHGKRDGACRGYN